MHFIKSLFFSKEYNEIIKERKRKKRKKKRKRKRTRTRTKKNIDTKKRQKHDQMEFLRP